MRLAARWVAFADRRRAPLLALCAALAFLGLAGTIRLYADLRPDLSELLPARSRSALDLAAVTQRVGGWAEASIVLTGADAGTLELFADDLAEALGKAPDGLIRWVEHRTDVARDFYQHRLLLFLSEPELRELRDTLAARQAWEAAGAKATGARPDLEGLVKRLGEGRGQQLGRWPDGYFVGEVPGRKPGERMTALALLVRLGGDQGDYGRVTALDRFIKQTVARLDPKKTASGPAPRRRSSRRASGRAAARAPRRAASPAPPDPAERRSPSPPPPPRPGAPPACRAARAAPARRGRGGAGAGRSRGPRRCGAPPSG